MINNLYIGNQSIGSLSIKSHPDHNKIKFDEIKFIGDQIFLNLHGITTADKVKPSKLKTELQGKVLINDLGKLLNQLDIYSNLKGTDTTITGKLSWNGSLSSFSSKSLFGKLEFKSQKGSISSIEHGIGRIISIFNLKALRRRLDLNFSDVSEQGFEFNMMQGDLVFKQETLTTKEIKINSILYKAEWDN